MADAIEAAALAYDKVRAGVDLTALKAALAAADAARLKEAPEIAKRLRDAASGIRDAHAATATMLPQEYFANLNDQAAALITAQSARIETLEKALQARGASEDDEAFDAPTKIARDIVEQFVWPSNVMLRGKLVGQQYAVAELIAEAIDAERNCIFAQAARIEALERSPGALAILTERNRQVDGEGWSAERDDKEYVDSDALIMAAIWYAAPDWLRKFFDANDINIWPWDECWRKPKDRRRDLERAGALIAAEIDRLDRARATLEGK